MLSIQPYEYARGRRAICPLLYSLHLQDFFRSSSGVDTGEMLKFSHKEVQNVPGEKGGRDGPRVDVFFRPRYRSVSRMLTAFCSYQESTRVSGSSLTPQPKLPDRQGPPDGTVGVVALPHVHDARQSRRWYPGQDR